jgi:hypothetical protein
METDSNHGPEESGSEKLRAYQRASPDGFITNALLKSPSHRSGGTIYSVVDDKTIDIRGDHFLPTFDSTDHLSFACEKCKTIADVLAIVFNPNYSRPPNPRFALFFYLECPKCGASGQRKIYLDEIDRRAFCHTVWHENKLYTYGTGNEPRDIYDAPILPKK